MGKEKQWLFQTSALGQTGGSTQCWGFAPILPWSNTIIWFWCFDYCKNRSGSRSKQVRHAQLIDLFGKGKLRNKHFSLGSFKEWKRQRAAWVHPMNCPNTFIMFLPCPLWQTQFLLYLHNRHLGKKHHPGKSKSKKGAFWMRTQWIKLDPPVFSLQCLSCLLSMSLENFLHIKVWISRKVPGRERTTKEDKQRRRETLLARARLKADGRGGGEGQ